MLAWPTQTGAAAGGWQGPCTDSGLWSGTLGSSIRGHTDGQKWEPLAVCPEGEGQGQGLYSVPRTLPLTWTPCKDKLGDLPPGVVHPRPLSSAVTPLLKHRLAPCYLPGLFSSVLNAEGGMGAGRWRMCFQVVLLPLQQHSK